MKLVKKWLTFITAIALIAGSVNYGSLFVNATAEDAAEYAEAGEDASVSGGDAVIADMAVSGGDANYGSGAAENTVDGSSTVGDALTAVTDDVLLYSSASYALAANSTATSRYYTFKDVTRTGGYGETHNVSAAGALDITFEGRFQEIQYNLPAGVDGKTLNKITFMIAEGNVEDLAIKILKNGVQAQVEYGKQYISITADLSDATSMGFALMDNKEGEASFVIDYFIIEAVQTGGSVTPPEPSAATTKYYTFNDVTRTGGYGETHTVSAAGALDITFNGKYQEIQYALPDGVDAGTLEKITFKVSGGDVSKLAIKILKNGTQAQDPAYGKDSISVSADLSDATSIGFALMNTAEGEASFAIEYFSITAEQTGGVDNPPAQADPTGNITPAKGSGADKRFTYKTGELAYVWMSESSTYESKETDKVKLSFSGRYDQIKLAFPEIINLKDCQEVTFAVSEQTGTLAFKLLDENGVDIANNGDYSWYGKTGATLYKFSLESRTEEKGLKYLVIMSDGSGTSECTFDGVLFKMSDTGEGPTENTTPAATSEFDKRYTVTAGGLTALDSDVVTCTPRDVEKAALTFSGAWAQINFELPEPIDLAYAKTVTFAISDQTVPLTFKLFNEKGFDYNGYNGIKAEYSKTGSYTMDITGLADEGTITHVSIALNSSDVKDVNTCLFDGVLFKMSDPGMKTHELVYSGSDLQMGNTENGASCAEAGGKYTMSFPAQNGAVSFKLPKIINMANCEGIQFTVSGQTGWVNYYLALDGSNKDQKYNFEPNTDHRWEAFTWTGGVDGIKVQQGGTLADGAGVTLEKITFTMKGEDGTNDFLNEEDADPEPPKVDVGDVENATPETAVTPGCEPERILAADLKIANENNVQWAKTTADQIQITFGGEWSELKLKLPQAVNLLQCKGVTFALSEQTVPISFKLYNEDTEIKGWYDHEQNAEMRYTYPISSTDQVTHIGIMLHKDDVARARAAAANYCVFDGVVFDMDRSLSSETHTVTYTADRLALKSSEASSCKLENGNWMIQFSAMDQKVNFTLPASVNLEKCISIIVTMAGQKGPVNFFVNADGVQQGDPYYYNTNSTTYTLAPGAASKINGFSIQCGREQDAYVDGAYAELVSVSFEMRGAAPGEAPADNKYPLGSLDQTSALGATAQIGENGGADIMFPNKDDSITYEVPDPVDVNHMTSMEFTPSLSGVKVQLLSAKGKVLMEGTGSTLATNCHSDVKYIRLVSLADNTTLHLDSIKFNVNPNAFEAIVLNGNFDREDLSMWGSALWDTATITSKTSDTEIIEGTGIYTYGEISKRKSPYNSFAQDVTARTKPGRGYWYSFWVKLSEDYADAPESMRTIEFAPYCLDGNMKEAYSMDVAGDIKKVCTPGEWVNFKGVVGLPDGAQGFFIRIVEQGTNYGQGACVMGSYAVTNVVMYETNYPAMPSRSGGGGGGQSRSSEITKEATCEIPYTMSDLSIDWASASTEKDGDKLRLGFTNNYDEVRLKLPRELDMSTCAYLKLDMSEQNVPVAVKLYWKGQQVDVDYYNDIKSSYTLVPAYSGKIDAIGVMSLATPNPAGAYALLDNVVFGLTEEPAPLPVYDTIVFNGDFAAEDMGDWSEALWGDGVTITRHTADKPIFDDVYTYATYSRRNSPYQCFAQDITGRVEQNGTYKFSFWAKLSNDYKNAPEEQRVVQFAPYTVDKNGNADYNPKLDGNFIQTLEPGVWTYFEGTYKVTNANPISKVVIRIREQGTNYGQGDCVMGSYSVAGVRMEKYIPEPPEIDEDVPNLKDAVREVFGDDFIMGTAVSLNEMEDLGIELLVNKHFNAVTLGNELKPDALFNYSNDQHTELKTITFNGQKLEVPTLYFGRAEEILNALKKWNESHPEDPIKVRGHVLVWHSQTPEWFFREGYTVKQNADGSENYVTPEVMNLRLEWYIKTVLEHFTGEDSPYRDMFYGWDVVNEAVGGEGYRTEKQASKEPLSQSTHSNNSSWWAVYQSNEFIINAFRFANKYAPADVELYYNDFNETESAKMKGIIKLLEDVKGAEGTRIDGMGMQGHYNVSSPRLTNIEAAIRAYAGVVGKVMITEFDLKAGRDISDEEGRQEEYLAQAKRYHDIYQLLQKLDAEEGIEIGGFTVWGTVDKYSWLQGRSNLGGGSDGSLLQCPLLFDSDYRIKPAYWAFVDYSKVDPDWGKEDTAEIAKPEQEAGDTSEATDTPDAPEKEDGTSGTEPESAAVMDTDPKVKGKKSNPIVPIAIAVGVAVVGAGAGAGIYLSKKKKK